MDGRLVATKEYHLDILILSYIMIKNLWMSVEETYCVLFEYPIYIDKGIIIEETFF